VRRVALIGVVLVAAALGITLAFGQKAQGSSTARFDVIFDDARGLVGGQLVKVAGARAGTIDNVVVTPDFKARVEASIESRFMPFHQDATCTIRPEGLIAENYIDCDPGSANSAPLRATASNPPTVPVQNTTEPVSLLDLFNMFNLPTRERFQVLIDELGIGTAGRGADFNDILRRANPALALARQAIGILARQKGDLATIVDATNTIAAEGASHTANLQQFLDKAASLTTLTAAHRDSLSQAIARLPGLLAAAQPALQQLDTVAVDGTPLVQQLHAAVPSLNQVTSDLGPFVKVARPGLAKLGGALKQAIPAIRDTTPLVTTLRSYTHRSLPGTRLFAQLASNLQQHGFVENFFKVVYSIATSLGRHDSTSHLLSILLVGPQNGACGSYATTPVTGCSAHYGQQASYTPGTPPKAAGDGTAPRANSHAPHQPRRSRSRPAQPSAPAQTTTTTPAPTSTAPGAAAAAPVQQTTQTLQNLVNYLLK
jgi:ABC-type transporter Mla subunit MlaD